MAYINKNLCSRMSFYSNGFWGIFSGLKRTQLLTPVEQDLSLLHACDINHIQNVDFPTVSIFWVLKLSYISCVTMHSLHLFNMFQLHCMSKPPGFITSEHDLIINHRETSDCLRVHTAKWKFSKNLRFPAGPVPDVLRRAFALGTGSH